MSEWKQMELPFDPPLPPRSTTPAAAPGDLEAEIDNLRSRVARLEQAFLDLVDSLEEE